MAADRQMEDLWDKFVSGDQQSASGNEEEIGVKHHQADQFSFSDVTSFGQKMFGGGGDKKGFDIGSLIGQGASLIGGGGGSKPAASSEQPEAPKREEKPAEPSAPASSGILDGLLGSVTDFASKNAAISGILGMISGTKNVEDQKKWINGFANKLVGDQGATAMAFILKKFQGNKEDSTVGKIISSAIGKKEAQMDPGSEEQKYLANVNQRLQADPTDPTLDTELTKILVENQCAPPGGDSGENLEEEESFQVKYVKRD